MALRLHTPETRAAASQLSSATVLFIIALILGTVLRFTGLTDRPMHTDEAVQAEQIRHMMNGEAFDYNPTDGHGPVLVYSARVVTWLCRLAHFPEVSSGHLRVVPALYGVLLLLLLPLLGDGLGRMGTAFAAIATALSPMMIFYSRYFIMEVPLVFFSTAAIACAWRYYRTREVGWVVVGAVMLGLMHPTKETCIFPMLAGGAALIAAGIGHHLLPSAGFGQVYRGGKPRTPTFRHFVMLGLLALTVSAFVYSGGFTRFKPNVPLSYTTYFSYLERGTEGAGHAKPFGYYFGLLFGRAGADGFWWGEPIIMVLGLMGIGSTLLADERKSSQTGHPKFLLWLSFYAVFLLLGYSVIPYKTPWTILGAEHAFCLLAGVGLASLLQLGLGLLATLMMWACTLLGVMHLGWQIKKGRGVSAVSQGNPLVYSHTSEAFLRIEERIHTLLPKFGGAGVAIVQVVHPEVAFPLPWYLRDVASVAYMKSIEDPSEQGLRAQAGFLKLLPRTHLVVTDDEGEGSTLSTVLARDFTVERYELRDGVPLLLYVRKDTAPAKP